MAKKVNSDYNFQGNEIQNAIIAYTESYSFWLTDEVKVAAGDTDFWPPIFVYVPTGYVCTVKEVRHKLNSGTSVTGKLTIAGSDTTDFIGMTITTTATTTNGAGNDTITNGQELAFVVTAVDSTPKNGSVKITLEFTKA